MFSSGIWSFILTYIEMMGIFVLWSKFNDNNKNYILKYGVLAIMICSINNILAYFNFQYIFFVNYCLIMFFVVITFKKSLKATIVEFIIIVVIIMVLQLLLLALFTVINGLIGLDVLGNEETKGLIINTIMLILSILIRKFIPYNNVLTKNLSMQIIFFYLISTFMYVFIIKSIWEADYNIIERSILKFVIILIIYIFINVKFLKALILLIEEKKNLEAYNRYSKLTIDLVKDVKSKQHDFKNHLSTIYGIVQVSNEKESREKIKEYIEGLNLSLSREQNIIALDNKVLAGIIYSKLQRAEEMNIKFTYSINSDISLLPTKDYELAEILFNLLDNAFEAVDKNKGEKWVNLVIDNNKKDSIIHVENSGATLKNKNLTELFKKSFSTKGNQRGFGLYNIKTIVDKYGGSIEVTTQSNSTEFILIFH